MHETCYIHEYAVPGKATGLLIIAIKSILNIERIKKNNVQNYITQKSDKSQAKHRHQRSKALSHDSNSLVRTKNAYEGVYRGFV